MKWIHLGRHRYLLGLAACWSLSISLFTHAQETKIDYLNCGEALLNLSFDARVLVDQADSLDLLIIKLNDCQKNQLDCLVSSETIQQQQLKFNQNMVDFEQKTAKTLALCVDHSVQNEAN